MYCLIEEYNLEYHRMNIITPVVINRHALTVAPMNPEDIDDKQLVEGYSKTKTKNRSVVITLCVKMVKNYSSNIHT